MFSVKRLRRKPKHFLNFTGLRPEQFDEVLEAVSGEYEAQEYARKNRDGRKRAIGGGRKFKLAIAERLLMTLIYHRLYVSYILLGYLLDLDDSKAGDEVRNRMQPALLAVLPLPMQNRLLEFGGQTQLADGSGSDITGLGQGQPKAQPKRKRLETLEELLKAHPEIEEVLIDATEQEIPRPKNKHKQKTHYSGKQSQHTIKTQVTTSKKLILHVSESIDGSVNDLTLLRASGVMRQIPKNLKARLDRGYESVEKEYPEVKVEKPIRSQRNHHLTPLAKAWNQVKSRARLPVEHLLAKLEKFKILSGEFRARLCGYSSTFTLVAGLINFKALGRLAW